MTVMGTTYFVVHKYYNKININVIYIYLETYIESHKKDLLVNVENYHGSITSQNVPPMIEE